MSDTKRDNPNFEDNSLNASRDSVQKRIADTTPISPSSQGNVDAPSGDPLVTSSEQKRRQDLYLESEYLSQNMSRSGIDAESSESTGDQDNETLSVASSKVTLAAQKSFDDLHSTGHPTPFSRVSPSLTQREMNPSLSPGISEQQNIIPGSIATTPTQNSQTINNVENNLHKSAHLRSSSEAAPIDPQDNPISSWQDSRVNGAKSEGIDQVNNGKADLKNVVGAGPNEVTTAPSESFSRASFSSVSIIALYIVAFVSAVPVATQYFNSRIGRDDYNISLDPGDETSDTDCTNSSGSQQDVLDSIQRDASKVMLMSSVASCVPAALTCLVVGSYSDFLGRRPLLVASVLGLLLKLGTLAAIIHFDLSIKYFYVGSFADGLLGSYFSIALAVTAIIADISPRPETRALRFAVMEGTVLVSSALAQLGVGYMIKEWGFLAPTATLVCLLAFALIITVFIMPETMVSNRNQQEFSWSPTLHLRKVFAFYFVKAPGSRRTLYALGLGIYMFFALTNLGRSTVETLFVLNAPICWSSMDIGIFQAIRLTVWSIVGVTTLKLLRHHLSLEVTGVMCGVSAAAGFFVESLATSGTMMYLAALAGILYATTVPIPRVLISQITSPSEQGALFSSLAFMETVGSLVANVLYTLLYNATLDVYKGAVFLFMAFLCCLSVILLGIFWLIRKRQPLHTLVVIETNVPVPELGLEAGSGSKEVSSPQSIPGEEARQAEVETSTEMDLADENTPLLAK